MSLELNGSGHDSQVHTRKYFRCVTTLRHGELVLFRGGEYGQDLRKERCMFFRERDHVLEREREREGERERERESKLDPFLPPLNSLACSRG